MTINLSELDVPQDQAVGLRVSERVAAILSDRIHSGIYNVGDLLPTERVLAAELRVHRRSVRSAIDSLVAEGLVSRRPNCRPTVGHLSGNRAPVMPPVAQPKLERQVNTRKATSQRISTSNLIALLMWHGGGPLEHAGTSQQRIFWGMNQSLMKLGYHAVFLDIGGDHIGSEAENAEREAKHLRYIRDQGFGGALFYPYAYRRNRDLVNEVSRTVPMVLLDRKIPGTDTDFVGIENYSALFDVTRQLIAQGHRRIAHVTRHEPIRPVQDRIQGYLDAMRSPISADRMSAADVLSEMILHVPPYWDERAWVILDTIFRLPDGERPTAATCVSDYMAVGVAERLAHLSLSTPGDVALTGFDNIVPTLPDGTGLTTVAQPYEEIGIAAVGLLMRRIKDRKAPATAIELPARLIVRESSGAQG